MELNTDGSPESLEDAVQPLGKLFSLIRSAYLAGDTKRWYQLTKRATARANLDRDQSYLEDLVQLSALETLLPLEPCVLRAAHLQDAISVLRDSTESFLPCPCR